jgi:hypothetical protein
MGTDEPRGDARKIDVKLPGKRTSNSHGARPVHQIVDADQ